MMKLFDFRIKTTSLKPNSEITKTFNYLNYYRPNAY